jgi:hypothetical protein
MNRIKKFWFVLNADSFLTGGAKLSFLVVGGGGVGFDSGVVSSCSFSIQHVSFRCLTDEA